MKAKDVRDIAAELRPIIDRELDDAEIKKGLSEAARHKGIAFAQLKALVKAQAQDARDGGCRVGKLVERADFACSYAEILNGHERKTENRSSSSSSERTDEAKAREVEQRGVGDVSGGHGRRSALSASAASETTDAVLQAGVGSERSSLTRSEPDLEIPDFLRRETVEA